MNDPAARDEVLRLLLAFPEEREELDEFLDGLDQDDPLDLSGCDLRGRSFDEVNFCYLNIDRADFRGATLSDNLLPRLVGARLDGATVSGQSFADAEDCTLIGVVMEDVSWNPNTFTRCDFRGAILTDIAGPWCTAIECGFAGATFEGTTDLEESTFHRCDFSRAVLAGAILSKCDFTESNLSGANLAEADLRAAKLVDVDLRGANLRDATLAGADLTRARIDGADFTGADLAGAVLDGLDLASAVNVRPTPARVAGPHMRELADVAAHSKRCQASVEIDLGEGHRVRLTAEATTYGGSSHPSVSYQEDFPPEAEDVRERGGNVETPTFEQGMLGLIDLWPRGRPEWATVEVAVEKCPLRAPELRELAVAAWHEALGLPVPSPEERKQQLAAEKAAAVALRAAMLAELTGGPAGVAGWNARPFKVLREFAPLRGHDFTGADLTGVEILCLDFRRSKFDGATLIGASLGNAYLERATFIGADLTDASMYGIKAPEAMFTRATLARVELRTANLRRAGFRGADLRGANLEGAHLQGADFTGASLDQASLARAEFDEHTTFPAGFVPSAEMIRKG